MIIYKLELAERTVEFVERMTFGYGKARFLWFSFDNETKQGECAYPIGKALGLEVYAVFDRDLEILKDFEIELLYNAFMGERFYNITKYEVVKVGERFVPYKEIDSFTGCYINNADNLEFVLTAFSRIGGDNSSVNNLILVSPNVKIEKFAKEIGIKNILKTQETEVFV